MRYIIVFVRGPIFPSVLIRCGRAVVYLPGSGKDINDLPDGVINSTVRLYHVYADDCILYRHVTDKNDINWLRTDLDHVDIIAKWEETG